MSLSARDAVTRRTLFLIIETLVFLTAEAGNALTMAPVPLSARVVAGTLIAAYFALGFLVPRRSRARTIVLALDAAFLGALAAYTGVALALTILLPIRAIELKPRDRRALTACIAFSLCAFALASAVGTFAEHRPFTQLAVPILLPPFALIVMLVLLSESLRQASAALAASNAELELRAERWQRLAILTERYQLGRDLQSEVGAGLRQIEGELERVLGEIDANSPAARAFAFHAQRRAAFTLAGLNRSVASLRDATLAQGDLGATLREMVAAFAASGSARTTAEIADVPVPDPAVAAGLESIAREALINVARHSNAARVRVSLGQRAGRLELVVADDGAGFDPNASSHGSGLTIVRERAALLGGTCEIESAPERGTTVRVTLPLPPRGG